MTSRLWIAYHALEELGFTPVALNILYRFGLESGHYRRTLARQARLEEGREWKLQPLFAFPSKEEILALIGEAGLKDAIAGADEIASGKVRLFGAKPVPLNLQTDPPLPDWSEYERGKAHPIMAGEAVADIKFVWEPARFGWVFPLGRAYWLTGDERYPQAFWQYFEQFIQSNPPYRGPNWMSAQEAALRILAFTWAAQVFAASPASTPAHQAELARAVALHARRIPPTFVYARSQQNNHLLVEAAGIFTAGLVLPAHPLAARWREQGWKWVERGLREQIDGYGEYAQHSTNYHRLVLQVVIWLNALSAQGDVGWSRRAKEAITRSVHWLLALEDPGSGRVPNLGANDGAYLFPLCPCPFEDHRPVLNAAARAFLGYDLPHGPWDELSLWFDIPTKKHGYLELPRYLGDQLYGDQSWAYLRTTQFKQRPSHADQLHLDLWWRGLNITRDAGTYLYNAAPPWENSLTAAQFHNTVTVNGLDQMERVGRFLYLDWVDAFRKGGSEADPGVLQKIQGRYRSSRGQYRHTRNVSAFVGGSWLVQDEILSLRNPIQRTPRFYLCRLHWLLPDWDWKIDEKDAECELVLESPHGPVHLTVSALGLAGLRVSLVRAGERLHGPAAGRAEPNRGWVSPTYGVLLPALSLAVESASADEVKFESRFEFP